MAEGYRARPLSMEQIAQHQRDLEHSLRQYFSEDSPTFEERFLGATPDDVLDELELRLEEIDLASSLTILAAIEAAFRIDYLERNRRTRRGKDEISRALRKLYKSKREKASLEEEIFGAWIKHSAGPKAVISDLRGAFKFRHWLAHGRYWTPNLGRRFDFQYLFALATTGVEQLRLLEAD